VLIIAEAEAQEGLANATSRTKPEGGSDWQSGDIIVAVRFKTWVSLIVQEGKCERRFFNANADSSIDTLENVGVLQLTQDRRQSSLPLAVQQHRASQLKLCILSAILQAHHSGSNHEQAQISCMGLLGLQLKGSHTAIHRGVFDGGRPLIRIAVAMKNPAVVCQPASKAVLLGQRAGGERAE